MSLDLNECIPECVECIKQYALKHHLKKGDKFTIPCKGIPKHVLPSQIISNLTEDPELINAMYDPVLWANKFLDWHCIDPDGKIWKRKHLEGSLGELPAYKEEQALAGRSIFHRPYQKLMLSCTAQNKVFRTGRQIGKTVCLCIAILYHIFTRNEFRVVVVAPYQSQIDIIFKNLHTYIKSNPVLLNSRLRYVKAPTYTLELKNGSQVTGFTAGTRSGGNADSARGQTAQMLVLDEADMLSPADLDSVMSITTNFPDATVWMSSTPTGKREIFYTTCQSRLFKEFHYPSHVNPNWTEAKDQLFKEKTTEEGYNHEVLAIWGSQEEGVYQNKYVEAAQDDYSYSNMSFNSNWIYTMGVDWNDVKIGVSLAVVGYNPGTHLFYIVDKASISRTHYTQLYACEKVVERNRIWNPIAIYLDAGYGSAQWEVLKKYGAEAMAKGEGMTADAKLALIVKKIDFGSNIETFDLWTKEPIKKPAKPFLVENSVRRFEQNMIRYPREDKMYTDALLGYVIKRVSYSGMPIYEEQNTQAGDHFLDAVNLALLAFTLEKTEFGQPRFETKISLGPPIQAKSQDVSIEKNRTDGIGKSGRVLGGPVHGLPAANINENNIPIWSWPGFLRDEPKPHNTFFSYKQRKTIGKPMPPKRSKF